jgi:hypothetical protein
MNQQNSTDISSRLVVGKQLLVVLLPQSYHIIRSCLQGSARLRNKVAHTPVVYPIK